MSFASLLQDLAGRPFVRRIADHFLGNFARRRYVQLVQHPVARVQERTLLRLVARARDTLFGRQHDFARIRSVADYQRRVPLRDYEAFWSEWWQKPFPFLQGVTWPDPAPWFALSSGTTSGATKYLPLTRQLLASNTKAALTTLALFVARHSGVPLLTGQLFFLGGSTELQELGIRGSRRILGGDLSGITALEASPWMRPYSFPPVELALLKDWDQKMDRLAREAARLPITMLSGIPSWLLVLFDRLRQATGKERISDIWPDLRLIIHGGTRFDPYRELFRQQVDPERVHFHEVYPASEGFVATEDPRFGLLRLIPDHDIFFEFIPVEELESPRPTRHTAGEVEVGIQYAIALTTCAGLWSYVLGDTVAFERRDPPLLRFTGRTKYFLSAFGEHLISEEVEKAIAAAASATGSAVVDFHVGPVFPDTPSQPGRHRYLVEFARPVPDLARFAALLDGELSRLNEDYAAHRQGDLTLLPPEILAVRHGGFADWMRSRGKLGGQHKVPRMDNSGQITSELTAFFQTGAASPG
jgi:hypothetical protein